MSDRSSRHTKTYVSTAETRRGVHGAPVANARAFFEVVEKSNLMEPEVLAETRELFAGREAGPAEPVARHLQERGLLTRWQCRQLLDGRSVFFLGRYKLRDRIGSGGMGTVFQAEHQMMDRVVALKVIRPKLLRDPHTLTRFLREIKAVASLVHPNIVTAYDADCVSDTYFLVMEHIDGKDLDSWVRAQGPLPMRWACDFCRQAALGLQHAHERGLVHRDIKPKNLLAVIDRGEKPPIVKILDFGLARLASDNHESAEAVDKTVIGSFGYMAPEHVREPAKADIRGDIFSLGCTLYFLLTGSPPFVGDSDEEVLDKLLHRHAAPLRMHLPGAPAALEQIVAKMLEPNPRDRFQTPQEVAQALASFSAITLKSFAGANAPVPLSALSPPLTPSLSFQTAPQTPHAGLENEAAGDWMLSEFADRLTHAPQSLDTGGLNSLLAADLGGATGTIPLPETRGGWSHHTVPRIGVKKTTQWPIVAIVAGALVAVAMLFGLWKLESLLRSDGAPANETFEGAAPRP